MTSKQKTARLLRQFGLMQPVDYFRFLLLRRKNRAINQDFRKRYPDVVLPPDYMMYESFKLDYERYYINGQQTAEWLAQLVVPHIDLNGASVLDWGCGPARIVRHLKNLIPEATYYGTDYNPDTIAWCSNTFDEIYFHSNDLMPGLVYEKEMFDLVYGISIFTHLSEEAHHAWLRELTRVLKPGGVLLLTLHGAGFRGKLTDPEAAEFDAGHLVVRGRVREGHRTFAAFHPEAWVRGWVKELEMIQHISGSSGEQDVYLLRRRLGTEPMSEDLSTDYTDYTDGQSDISV